MLAVRGENCDGTVDVQIYGETSDSRSAKAWVYKKRTEATSKRCQQFAFILYPWFSKAHHNQGISVSIRWTMVWLTMVWEGELYTLKSKL